MRFVNLYFQEWPSKKDGFISVCDDFIPLNRLPRLGYEWRWLDFENGSFEERKIINEHDFTGIYNQVDTTRRALYTAQVDPLLAEAAVKKAMGLEQESADFIQQALALRAKIQKENPFPEPVSHG